MIVSPRTFRHSRVRNEEDRPGYPRPEAEQSDRSDAYTMMTPQGIDKRSFSLGMIFAFAEIVAAGVKPLALSPPLKHEEYTAIKADSDTIVNDWRLHSYVEHDFLQTDLFPEDALRDIVVILYYRNPAVLEAYLQLKETQRVLVSENRYGPDARRSLARRFGELLGYSDEALNERLGTADGPFSTARLSLPE